MSTDSTGSAQQSGSEIGRPRLLQRVHEAIRVRHYSRRTEEAYVHWIKRLIYFHGKRHPETMGEAEVTAFLNHLAVERHVAAATQNQALSAILFLYREVLLSAVPFLFFLACLAALAVPDAVTRGSRVVSGVGLNPVNPVYLFLILSA